MSKPKTHFQRKQKLLPDEKSHGLGTQQESRKKVSGPFPTIWVKEPRHSDTISDEKRCLYRSARLLYRHRISGRGFVAGDRCWCNLHLVDYGI